MTKVQDIYAYIDGFAPFATQMDFDNAGLLVGDGQAEVRQVLLALDATMDVVRQAERKRCQLIMTHHPLIFHPLKAVRPEDPTQAIVARLIRKNIALICAHTNLDAAPGGVNDVLMDRLGAKVTGVLEPMGEGYGMGRVGELKAPMEPRVFAAMVKKALGAKAVRATLGKAPVKRLAVCGGAGSDMLDLAVSLGADAFVTADVKHHEFLAAQALGVTLIDSGHFSTENPVIPVLAERLSRAFGKDGVECFLAVQKEPYCQA